MKEQSHYDEVRNS